MAFSQEGPILKNAFSHDPLLPHYLKHILPSDIYKKIEKHLNQVGEDAATKLLQLVDEAESQPPVLVQYDSWGKRIDQIKVCRAWRDYEAYASQNGIVASAYEREFDEFSRVYQMSLLYLFHPSSALASCPLAMTDGAARAIEVFGDEELKEKAYQHLISRNPQTFWTSGQWMTEKIGGSDVGPSETIAKKTKDGYALYGTKWFTSAATSQMAMTLARIEGDTDGGRGLSLFYLETFTDKECTKWNHIEVLRLKDKLGTRAMPTAELTLNGTPAKLVGDPGNGVRKISTLFNITRIYNAISSVAQMRRGIALACDFAEKRKAFGKKLIDLPLHKKTLDDMDLEWRGCFHFVFKATTLLGKDECKKANKHEQELLRVLTPMVKLYTGKSVVNVTTEVVESFGGAGYIEDTKIPRLLRDAQVLSIWEGTTNVLSLDMLRAFKKENGYGAFEQDFQERVNKLKDKTFQNNLKNIWKSVSESFQEVMKKDEETIQSQARHFAFLFSRIYIASLLIEFAEKTNEKSDLETAHRWIKTF